MKQIALYIALLAMGIVISAWLGKLDAKPHSGSPGQSRLNTTTRQRAESVAVPEKDVQYEESLAQRTIYRNTRTLLPMAKPLAKARPGEWRSQVREPEQDFAAFVNDSRRVRGILLVQPIGSLSPDQSRAIDHLLDAMSHFFGMPAHRLAPIPLENLPRQCFRTQHGHRQLNAEYLMENILQHRVGGDVASILALTDLDIYPGERWPFESAYGWSSFTAGTSVLSTNMILEAAPADGGRNLLRMTKLGLHELGHTFTLKHCAKYNCLMNGCSDIGETDSKPLLLCPDCLAKISLATGREPKWHLRSMLELCKRKGFFDDANAYYRALTMLKQL